MSILAVPFDEIAPNVDRSPEAARQLASRARRRFSKATSMVADADLDTPPAGRRRLSRRRALAARVLDPDVVLRADLGPRRAGGWGKFAEPAAVANQAPRLQAAQPCRCGRRSSTAPRAPSQPSTSRPYAVTGFTIRSGRIVEIDVLADAERFRRLALTILQL